MSDVKNGTGITWTPEQERAIAISGGSMLVTASAGAGKTAVLTERIMRRITAETAPLDLRRLVVVTFTKAAAVEMKTRLYNNLAEHIASHPWDKNAKRQLMHIHDANISTIDSFCMSLIEKYQAEKDVGFAPGMRLVQESEQKRLIKKAIADAVDDGYAQGDESFYALADAMSDGGSGDGSLKELINKLHDIFSRSPDPDKLRERFMRRFEDADYCDIGRMFGNMFDNIRAAADYFKKESGDLIANAPLKDDPDALGEHLSQLGLINSASEKLGTAAVERDAKACAEAMSCTFDAKLAYKKIIPKDWHSAVTGVKSEFTSFCKNGADGITFSEDALREEAALLRPMIAKLFDTLALAEEKYEELKKERRVWDFADIELKASSLLWEKGEDGKMTRTAISLAEAAAHDEILIDEYQDVNELQESIFNGICSKDNDNIFMVGDVKQSVYRFRGAAPRLFLKHRNDFFPVVGDDVEFPAKIALNTNFRSRACVTEAVNAVFDAIMTRETGGINYAEDDRLSPADTSPKAEGCGAYLTLVAGKSEDEGRCVAARIKELMDSGFTVRTAGGTRPLRYGDVAILLRTIKNRTKPFVDALKAAGIPVCTPESGDPLQVPEVRRMISVLRAIDNPMKDIHLAAAMRSDVFTFTDSELALIRTHKRGALYYAVKAAADSGDVKCADFLAALEHLRRKAASLTADKLIWYIYKTSGSVAFASMRKGDGRAASALMQLYESAVVYGAAGRRDLSGFVSFLDHAAENGGLGSVSSASSGDEVTVMSIHKSKGLEFPVCFICDTAKAFNTDAAPFIADEIAGVGIKLASPAQHRRRVTAALASAQANAAYSEKREEMRLLYVAMTRAIDRLEIVGAVKDPKEFARDCRRRFTAGGRMDEWAVRSAKRTLEWIAPVALARPDVFEVSTDTRVTVLPGGGEERKIPEPDKAMEQRIFDRINGKYAHPDSVSVPTKLTVSEIVAMKAGKSGDEHCCERRPACLDAARRSGAEAGTATHAFLQFADFAKLGDPEAELDRLVAERFMTERQAKLVDRRKLDNFISSDIFRRIGSADSVTREFRFTFEADASDFLKEAPEEKLLVQGAIDCVFEEDGKCVVVDYKTDRITGDNIGEKAAHYKPQLEIYARGLRELTGKEVSEAFLFFLDTGETVKVI